MVVGWGGDDDRRVSPMFNVIIMATQFNQMTSSIIIDFCNYYRNFKFVIVTKKKVSSLNSIYFPAYPVYLASLDHLRKKNFVNGYYHFG